jgi:WD40 repeat protein
LVALNPDPENAVLATPDQERGYVRVNVYEKNKSVKILAHQSALSAMCLNYKGTLLATASDKGTLIRIYSTESGKAMQELRRGAEKADIYSICFDMKSLWLACSSDRSTVHIFSVKTKLDHNDGIKLSDEEETKILNNEDEDGQKGDADRPQNKKSKLNFISGILPKYFDSEWSYGRFKIPNDDNSLHQTCAFNPEGTHLIVVSSEGTYYLAEIPKSKGNCKIIEKKSLI